MKPELKKTFVWAAVIIAILLIAYWVYRYFFEFKNSDVKANIATEAAKYSDKSTAASIIHESAMHILNSSTLTSQVRAYATANKLPKEKVLVDAATAQAQSFQYLASA